MQLWEDLVSGISIMYPHSQSSEFFSHLKIPLKNPIDVNKLSVYTPDTEYACSFFAQLRGGLCEAARPQAGASRKGNIVLIVPLDPAYKRGLRGTCRSNVMGRSSAS